MPEALAALASASCFLSFSRSSLACSASLWALSLATLAASFRYAEALGSLLISSSLSCARRAASALSVTLSSASRSLVGSTSLGAVFGVPALPVVPLSSDVRTFDPALPVVPLSSDVRTLLPSSVLLSMYPWGSMIQSGRPNVSPMPSARMPPMSEPSSLNDLSRVFLGSGVVSLPVVLVVERFGLVPSGLRSAGGTYPGTVVVVSGTGGLADPNAADWRVWT